jgi:transposase
VDQVEVIGQQSTMPQALPPRPKGRGFSRLLVTRAYASDISREKFAEIEPLLRTGCPWRFLPADFPKREEYRHGGPEGP